MEDRQKIYITTGSWIRAIVVLAIAYALFLVREFILVVVASVVIASAIEPAASWAKRRNIPRLPMVLLVYTFSALVLFGLFYFLLLPLIGEMSSFIRTLTVYSNSVTSGGILSDMFRTQNLFGGFDTPVLIRELSSYLNSLSGFLSRGVFSSVSLIFGGVLNFILILVLSFYLVVQDDGIGKFLKIITPLKHEQYVVALWKRSQHKIGRWMQGQLLSSALVALLVYIGLILVGVPHALLLAVMAGVFELIPFFGSVLSAIPAIFIAYISGGMNIALIVVGLYIIIQQLEGNLIYPLVVEKVVGVPPMVSIMALVIGAILAGFLGALISVPVAAAIIEFISDLEKRKITQTSGTQSS
ncbi:MAG: AI-2E family transporter [Candidatus Zambryskibacteria bacterium]|nr:AI-2E family transporter [Candidatus Zambryskibacteria bacterium]